MFLLFLLFSLSCGYSPRSLLPSHLRTVAIVDIANSSTQPGLAEELNTALLRAFNTDRSFRVTSEERANLTVSIVIASYSRSASVYDATQLISAYEINIGAQVDAFDRVRNEPFFTGTVSARLSYRPEEKSEEKAIQQTIDKLAQEIVRQLITTW